ncbi:MAG: SDR family NAD-dependent epimerase/dehydratase, partial [Patescibacteria group bacterium]
GKELEIYGDENFRTSLAYVSDIVDGIIRLMQSPQDIGAVNLGSDQDVRLVDVAEHIKKMVNSSAPIVFKPPLLFMTQLGLPDLTRAKDQLGWIPLVTLDQGLKKSVEYTVAHKGLIRPQM